MSSDLEVYFDDCQIRYLRLQKLVMKCIVIPNSKELVHIYQRCVEDPNKRGW